MVEAIRRSEPSGRSSLEALRALGGQLYLALLRQIEPELRERPLPIILSSNMSELRWELLHDGEEFLGLKYALGRRLKDIRSDGSAERFVGKKPRCLIVVSPGADDQEWALPEASRYAADLRAQFELRGIGCDLMEGRAATRQAITCALSSRDYDIFHYSGHIVRDSHSGLECLSMTKGELLSSAVISELGGGPRLVFLQGCNSEFCESTPTGDLADSFGVAGAQSVVASTIKTPDHEARFFAQRFYDLMLEGKTCGEAIRRARIDSMNVQKGTTWASYVMYGDPRFSVVSNFNDEEDRRVRFQSFEGMSGVPASITSETASSAPAPREFRVFVSSTFDDLREEREVLAKHVFPQLRHVCQKRGVSLTEVDLRWGASDESKAEGGALPRCLDEIERKGTYFIAVLGERYGYVPEEISEGLLNAQPWLVDHGKDSVTAIEIQYGALRNLAPPGSAFFYFRDPLYSVTRRGYTERDARRRERLMALKQKIRQSFHVREGFSGPAELGKWVLEDLTAAIDRLYPALDACEFLSVPDGRPESFRGRWIERHALLDALDAHVAGAGMPLVLMGHSGSGKSALLDNWVHRWREHHPMTPVLAHFIGSKSDCYDWAGMVRRILSELERHYSLGIEIPERPDELRRTFGRVLDAVADRERLIIVMDGLDRIEDREGAPEFWIPLVFPSNVRLVVSTRPGRSWEVLCRRSWPVLTIEPPGGVKGDG